MSKEFFWTIFKRFARAFLAGGLTALTVQLAGSPQPGFDNLADTQVWLVSLLYAFLVGGVMALEKAARWTD